MESVRCDICDTNAFEVVRIERQASHAGAEWYPVVTSVCDHCGHVFLSLCLTSDEMTRFYEGQLRESFDVPRGEKIGLFQADADLLTRYTGDGAGRRALEVGCYTGYMLKRLHERGWRPEGIEPNHESAARARVVADVPVHECMFEAFVPPSQEGFDLVFMGSVLEHVRSPTDVLLRANRMLKIGGHVFIRVPDLYQLVVSTVAEMFSLEHPHTFTSDALNHVAEKTGFDVVTVTTHDRIGRHLLMIARKTVDTVDPLPVDSVSNRNQVISTLQEYGNHVDHTRSKISVLLQDLWFPEPRRVIIYGAGTHTELLLRHTTLARANLVCLVDSNPRKWGSTFLGLTIREPTVLEEDDYDAVVISSQAFEADIYERLRPLEARGKRIVRLYADG